MDIFSTQKSNSVRLSIYSVEILRSGSDGQCQLDIFSTGIFRFGSDRHFLNGNNGNIPIRF